MSRTRRTIAGTKEALLRAGVDVVREHGVSRARELDGVLGFVKMDEVSAKASVGKTMIYHIWPSQAAYRQDLLRVLASESASSAVSVNAPADGLIGYESMFDLADALVEATIIRQTSPEIAFPYSLLLGNAANSDIGEAFADGCEAATDASVEFLRTALDHFGHEPVSDASLTDFVVLARVVLRGMTMQICLGDRAVAVDGAPHPRAVELSQRALRELMTTHLGVTAKCRQPIEVGVR